MVDDRIILRGVSPEGADGRPTILQRTDQDFIEAVLDELSAGDDLRAVGASVVSGGGLRATGLAQQLEKAHSDTGTAVARKQLARRVNRRGGAAPFLQLFQPVHRTFHIALVEAVCDSFMKPRLDPERIESAGLVVRRTGVAGAAEEPQTKIANGRPPAILSRRLSALAGRPVTSPEATRTPPARQPREGWMRSGKRVRGWVTFGDEELANRAPGVYPDPGADPDPKRRPAPLRSGHAGIDERLAQWLGRAEPLAESVTPLFVAPPDVCKAAGRTILYGVIPVTSVEKSEPPPSGSSQEAFTQTPPFDLQALRDVLPSHLPSYLQRPGRIAGNTVVPLAEQSLTFKDASNKALERFVLTLRQLRYEFDAFGESTREGEALFGELNTIFLSYYEDQPVRTPDGQIVMQPRLVPRIALGVFLKAAADAFVELDGKEQAERGESIPVVRMPPFWTPVSAAQETRLVNLVFEVLRKRLEGLAVSEGRFDDPRASYCLRAFVRVKRRDGCPPVVCWSDYSEPFTIAAWYESGDVPPVQIQLPDASAPGFLDKVKPNVAFVVPESLQNLLNLNKPDDFLKGEAGAKGGGIGLDWICGFNIPTITLCAFIVLNIFLQLLNIVFSWLLFIKICIPFPRKK